VKGKVSTTEAADYFGCSPKTIRRWIADGHLEATRPYRQGPFYIDEIELFRFNPRDASDYTRALPELTKPTSPAAKHTGPTKQRLKPWRPGPKARNL
jgi:excisionase family DNA binding protein